MTKQTVRWFCIGLTALWVSHLAFAADPQLTIPTLPAAPVIDGKIDAREWQYAAALTGLMGLENRCVRAEQPVFYIGRHGDNLYVGMKSQRSSYDQIVAACALRDNRFICGDDAVELMMAPGHGEAMKDPSFATYYMIVNAIGNVFDQKLVHNFDEMHVSWNIPLETASTTDGSAWECEIRIPLAYISSAGIKDGDTWRMNFTRSNARYIWTSWVPGGLETPLTGGDVTFDAHAPAARLLSVQPLIDGKLGVSVEIANAGKDPCAVQWSLQGVAVDERAKKETAIGSATETVNVGAGEVKRIELGKQEPLSAVNKVFLEAKDGSGKVLLKMERRVVIPAPCFTVKKSPPQQLVYVNSRYLPSLNRLAVYLNTVAWAKNKKIENAKLTAAIKVYAKGEEMKAPVLEGTFAEFVKNEGTWRTSTEKLAENEYTVLVTMKDEHGAVVQTNTDWFIKKQIPYMTTDRRGVVTEVPPPFTALEVAGREIKPWGRVYRFGENGLPEQIVSQGREILAGAAQLKLKSDGKELALQVTKPLAVVKQEPGRVEAQAELRAGDVVLTISSVTEYDGLTRMKIAYGPAKTGARLDGMVLEIPLRAERARFYNTVGDFLNLSGKMGVLPEKEGIVHDSLHDTVNVTGSPTFSPLFWVGDYDVCFCYCADSDEGWIVDDSKPELEVERKGGVVTLRLNLVGKPSELTRTRTLEFGLQAGPVKPLPADWRSYQHNGDPDVASNAWSWCSGLPRTWGFAGGTHLVHPGDTPELRAKSRAAVTNDSVMGLPQSYGRNKVIKIAYCFWPVPPKGRPEVKVYRGEWGIDQAEWERAAPPDLNKMKFREKDDRRPFGDDPDMYALIRAKPTPSLIDFYVYCWDESVKEMGDAKLWGFYFDTGYPNPVFDPELGLGYVRDDGRPCYAMGIWLYRDLLKRLAYVNYQHRIPNCITDGQHVAHLMPAYGFCQIFAPSEGSLYGANFDAIFGKYMAMLPARQFGQVPVIGLTPAHDKDPLGFALETREQMMVVMLHDQDLGSWGNRDWKVVNQLRSYRNKLLPWQADVKFMGYWENSAVLQTGNPQLLGSLYACPRGALLIFGNISSNHIQADIAVDWKKLGFDLAKCKVTDAEDPALRLVISTDGKLTLFVPAHGLRLIAVEPKK